MSAHRRLLYAHRGAAAEEPENTVPSFRRALELGADALEMDVHLTRDGEVVVAHDPDGRRMCGVDARIAETPLAELRRWDAGHGFVGAGGERPFAGRGYRVPTLDEVLEAFPLTPLNIDLKPRSLAIVGRTLRVLRRHRAEERVCLASFHLGPLLYARSCGYAGRTAIPSAEVVSALAAPGRLWRRLPLRGRAAQIPVRHGRMSLARPWVIERLHRAGLRVDYWTVNQPEEAERLLALGADGIMTDDPRAVAPVVRGAPAADRPQQGDRETCTAC